MKVTYTSGNGRLTLHAEGDIKQVFEQISEFDEVFANHTTCKATGSADVSFRVRTVEGNKYYEVVANETGHKLAFGQTKEGGKLFPRRKDKEGNWLSDSGWVKWDPNTKTASTATTVI